MNKKYIIVLNGNMPKSINRDFFNGSFVVCADGAYRHLKYLAIRPDILIGDFDSISDIPKDINKITFDSDKDFTDGQLSVKFAVDNGATEIVIIGAAGGRDDHYLGNLSLLFYAQKLGVKSKILTDECEVFAINGKIEIDCPKNKYFSIVPFSNELHIMNTEGLKYKVTDKSLYIYETLGISNCTTEEKVVIDTACGVGLAFLTFEDVK